MSITQKEETSCSIKLVTEVGETWIYMLILHQLLNWGPITYSGPQFFQVENGDNSSPEVWLWGL